MNEQQKTEVERIIEKEEMKRLEQSELATMLNFGGEDDYLAGYNGHTYVLREKQYYELLK